TVRLGFLLSAPEKRMRTSGGMKLTPPHNFIRNIPYRDFPLPVPCFVHYSIVFLYVCLDLFSRCLWIAAAFLAVRFNVRGINRSDIQQIGRIFS
ncbi:hypothetical protein, partial [Enterobacter sp. Bisph1]|uniref:hypothetical protein n=1 Tax=Enterobacter sp. Bisph1 TaxID=1274399 RepID=UPI001E2BA37D